MQEVKLIGSNVWDSNKGRYIYKDEVLTGVVSFQAGNEACDIGFYNNRALLVPFANVERIERRALTDEDILNGEDKEFAAWYKERIEEAERKLKEEEEAAKAENNVVDIIGPDA